MLKILGKLFRPEVCIVPSVKSVGMPAKPSSTAMGDHPWFQLEHCLLSHAQLPVEVFWIMDRQSVCGSSRLILC